MEAFVGISGAYYVRNPFGAKDYHFAVYPSKEKYGHGLPTYVSESEAYTDSDGTNKVFERWEFQSPKGVEIIECLVTGEIVGSEMAVYEYRLQLINQYGYEAVSANKL